MKEPEIPVDEEHRLDALRTLDILDTGPEVDFDAIVNLGKELFGVPICLVSLVDSNRQWFKACVGLDTSETPRAVSFCGHAILQQGPFVILDATEDRRFSDNPLVTGAPFVRFYAGMPIRLPSGYQVGTVCLIDHEAHASFGPSDIKRLAFLSELAVTAMGLRGMRKELDSAHQTVDRFRAAVHLAPIPIALTDPAGRVEESNAAFNEICRADPMEGQGAGDLMAVSAEEWTMAAAALDESEVRTGTDGRKIRVVPDGSGLILVGKQEPAAG